MNFQDFQRLHQLFSGGRQQPQPVPPDPRFAALAGIPLPPMPAGQHSAPPPPIPIQQTVPMLQSGGQFTPSPTPAFDPRFAALAGIPLPPPPPGMGQGPIQIPTAGGGPVLFDPSQTQQTVQPPPQGIAYAPNSVQQQLATAAANAETMAKLSLLGLAQLGQEAPTPFQGLPVIPWGHPGNWQPPTPPTGPGAAESPSASIYPIKLAGSGIGHLAGYLPPAPDSVSGALGSAKDVGGEFLAGSDKPRQWNTTQLGGDIYDISQGKQGYSLNPTFYVEGLASVGTKGLDQSLDALYGRERNPATALIGIEEYSKDPAYKAEIANAMTNGFDVKDQNGKVIKHWDAGPQAVWEQYQQHKGLIGRIASSVGTDPQTYFAALVPVGEGLEGFGAGRYAAGKTGLATDLATALGKTAQVVGAVPDLPFTGPMKGLEVGLDVLRGRRFGTGVARWAGETPVGRWAGEEGTLIPQAQATREAGQAKYDMETALRQEELRQQQQAAAAGTAPPPPPGTGATPPGGGAPTPGPGQTVVPTPTGGYAVVPTANAPTTPGATGFGTGASTTTVPGPAAAGAATTTVTAPPAAGARTLDQVETELAQAQAQLDRMTAAGPGAHSFDDVVAQNDRVARLRQEANDLRAAGATGPSATAAAGAPTPEPTPTAPYWLQEPPARPVRQPNELGAIPYPEGWSTGNTGVTGRRTILGNLYEQDPQAWREITTQLKSEILEVERKAALPDKLDSVMQDATFYLQLRDEYQRRGMQIPDFQLRFEENRRLPASRLEHYLHDDEVSMTSGVGKALEDTGYLQTERPDATLRQKIMNAETSVSYYDPARGGTVNKTRAGLRAMSDEERAATADRVVRAQTEAYNRKLEADAIREDLHRPPEEPGAAAPRPPTEPPPAPAGAAAAQRVPNPETIIAAHRGEGVHLYQAEDGDYLTFSDGSTLGPIANSGHLMGQYGLGNETPMGWQAPGVTSPRRPAGGSPPRPGRAAELLSPPGAAEATPPEATVGAPEQAAPTTESRPLPPYTDNQLKPLSTYSDRLYRETSPHEFYASHHPITNRSPGGSTPGDFFFANTPDLALGQGTNKGVLMELDSAGIDGFINTRMPGWRFAYENGHAELMGQHLDPYYLSRNVRRFTFSPEAAADIARDEGMQRSLDALERKGWRRFDLEDGSVSYARPDAVAEGPLERGIIYQSPEAQAFGRQADSTVPTAAGATPVPAQPAVGETVTLDNGFTIERSSEKTYWAKDPRDSGRGTRRGSYENAVTYAQQQNPPTEAVSPAPAREAAPPTFGAPAQAAPTPRDPAAIAHLQVQHDQAAAELAQAETKLRAIEVHGRDSFLASEQRTIVQRLRERLASWAQMLREAVGSEEGSSRIGTRTQDAFNRMADWFTTPNIKDIEDVPPVMGPVLSDNWLAELQRSGKIDQGTYDRLTRTVTFEGDQVPLYQVYDESLRFEQGNHEKAMARFISNVLAADPRLSDIQKNKLLTVIDEVNRLGKENIMFNLASGIKGILGDAAGDSFLTAITQGLPTAVRGVDPRKWLAVRRFLSGSKEALHTLPSLRYTRDMGIVSTPQEIMNVPNRAEGARGQDMSLKRLLKKGKLPSPVAAVVAEPFQSQLYAAVRSDLDTVRRLSLWADTIRKAFPEARNRFRLRLAEDAPGLGRSADDLWAAIQGEAKTRVEAGGGKFTGQFSPDDVLAATGNADLARAWRGEVSKMNEAGRSAVRQTLFSYEQRTIDQQMGRLFFFHYWQSRAVLAHGRAALEHPALLATYVRTWQALQNDSKVKGYPPQMQGFLKFMGDVGSYWSFLDPVGVLTPWSIFREAAYQNGNGSAFDRILKKSHLFLNPLIGAAAHAVGYSDNAVDPTSTYSIRNMARAIVNYDRNHGDYLGFGPGVSNDVVNQAEAIVYRNTSRAAAFLHLPFAKQVTAVDRTSFDKVQINTIITKTLEDQYGPIAEWHTKYDVIGADGQPSNPVYARKEAAQGAVRDGTEEKNQDAQDAEKKWSAHGLSTLGLNAITPGGVRTYYGPKQTLDEQSKAFFAGDKSDTAQAAATEKPAIEAGSTEGANLVAQQANYQGLGDSEQQFLVQRYDQILFNTLGPGENIMLGGTVYDAYTLGQMTQDQRQQLADEWLKRYANTTYTSQQGITSYPTSDAPQQLADVQALRKTFRESPSNPEYGAYSKWRSDIYDPKNKYGGNVTLYRQAMSKASPAYRQYIDSLPADLTKDQLDQKSVSTDAYLASEGLRATIYDPKRPAALDISQINATDLLLGLGGGSGQGGGAQTDQEKLDTAILDYTEKKQLYDQAVVNATGTTGGMDNPFFKQVLNQQLATAGITEPSVPGIVSSYMAWMQTRKPGEDTSTAAYIQWRNSMRDQLIGQGATPLLPTTTSFPATTSP